MNKPKILILGAGYAGIMTAVRLQKKLEFNEAEVTLVNKHNYHYQTTYLHEVAAGNLHHDSARLLIDDLIDITQINFIQDKVIEIKKDENKVILENTMLYYDYLVIALGFEPNDSHVEGFMENSFNLNSIVSSRKIKDHIEYQFSSYTDDLEKKEERLTIVVGGAGFTGIQFIGELADRIPKLCKEYDIEPEKVRLINVETSNTILPELDPKLAEYAHHHLEKNGVEFKLGTTLKKFTEEGVLLTKEDNNDKEDKENKEDKKNKKNKKNKNDKENKNTKNDKEDNNDNEEFIKANTVIWSGGTKANSLVEGLGFESVDGRLKVNNDLRLPGKDNVFVIGDCSLITNKDTGEHHRPSAALAIQQGNSCSINLVNLIRDVETVSFVPDVKGTFVSIAKGKAVGKIGNKRLYGTSAYAMKKIIENRNLFLLGGPAITFKNGRFDLF